MTIKKDSKLKTQNSKLVKKNSVLNTQNLKLNICVVGMGYVGIPAAVLLAAAGHDVTGIQRKSKRSGWKIDWLNQGKCPIGNEPELPEMLAEVVQAKRFRVTDDYAAIKSAEMILIDVQTPTDENHIPRYESLREVCHIIGKLLKPGQIVVIESTVAPGTTQYLVKPILEEESGLKAGLPEGFGLTFSYERVMVGRLIHNIREYPKIVGGIDELSTQKAMAMYRTIVKGGVHGTNPMTSEVAKTVENAYRDVQIAFANEVALLCESLGIDVYDVRKFVNGLPNDPSVPHANPVRNMHFPGAGVGGHCLPKDTWLLMHGYQEYGDHSSSSNTANSNKNSELKTQNSRLRTQYSRLSTHYSRLSTQNSSLKSHNLKKYPCSILEDARYLNDWMPVHMADLLESAIVESCGNLLTLEKGELKRDLKTTQDSSLSGLRIAVLGYAFLENSDDARNTPTVPFLKELEKRGAKYTIHDPYIQGEPVTISPKTQNSKLKTDVSQVLSEEGYTIEQDLNKVLKGSDALVVMAKHSEYAGLTPQSLQSLLKSKIIVDGRNLFDPAPFIKAGFVFKGVGKGNINNK
jgi:UDP-N-acetyl-D-mannosaminuronic acid dehydrogenase